MTEVVGYGRGYSQQPPRSGHLVYLDGSQVTKISTPPFNTFENERIKVRQDLTKSISVHV